MPRILELELGKTAYVIVKELFRLQSGESLLITVDSKDGWKAALEVAKAAEAIGGKVMVAWHSSASGYGKTGDSKHPTPLKAAISDTDAWLELNKEWLLYSTPWEMAMKKGSRIRYLFMGGLGVEQLHRCVGKINWPAQEAFQNKLAEMTRNTNTMRLYTEAGTDVTFDNIPSRSITNELRADVPGPHFLTGQIGWAPREETIKGTIVFDGAFSGGGIADIGILTDPIILSVKRGRIVNIEGKREAEIIKSWIARLDDDRMYNLVHVCYGYNPGARLSGICTEDERVWGCTGWGIGYQGIMFDGNFGDAASHADGICLNTTVYMDGKMIIEKGVPTHPELKYLADECRRGFKNG